MSKEKTQKTASLELIVLAIAVGLGVIVRIRPVMTTDFPLMDGGMFYAMVRDLQASHFRLPAFASYNAANIPFVYPPLALYLAATVQSLTGWRLEEVFRWLPLMVNLLTIPAFYALARQAARSESTAAIAAIAFALLPETAHWQIMGGGLTRSFGLLFAILALRSVYLMYARGQRRDLLLAVGCAACAVLSHPQMAWFTVYSTGLMFLVFGRNRAGVIRSFLLGIGVIAVTSPWWGTILARYGFPPFLAATQHGLPVFSGLSILLFLGGTSEPFVPVLGMLALLGTLVCLTDRKPWLPAWVLVTFALDNWIASAPATLPIALLVGIGCTDVLWSVLTGRVLTAKQQENNTSVSGRRLTIAKLVAYLFLTYVLLGGVAAASLTMAALSSEEREAMQWVARNTPASSRFLIVTSERWGEDRSSEWFPVLAQRVSVGTVQGSEWIAGGEFVRRVKLNAILQACVWEGADCLERWMTDAKTDVEYVYIPKRRAMLTSVSLYRYGTLPDDCCRPLRDALRIG